MSFFGTKQDRDIKVAVLKECLAHLPKVIQRTKCDGGCKYGTYPHGCFADCECPRIYDNPECHKIDKEIQLLSSLKFCTCGGQIHNYYVYCPYCTSPIDKQDIPIHKFCNYYKNLVICPDCGEKN